MIVLHISAQNDDENLNLEQEIASEGLERQQETERPSQELSTQGNMILDITKFELSSIYIILRNNAMLITIEILNFLIKLSENILMLT